MKELIGTLYFEQAGARTMLPLELALGRASLCPESLRLTKLSQNKQIAGLP